MITKILAPLAGLFSLGLMSCSSQVRLLEATQTRWYAGIIGGTNGTIVQVDLAADKKPQELSVEGMTLNGEPMKTVSLSFIDLKTEMDSTDLERMIQEHHYSAKELGKAQWIIRITGKQNDDLDENAPAQVSQVGLKLRSGKKTWEYKVTDPRKTEPIHYP